MGKSKAKVSAKTPVGKTEPFTVELRECPLARISAADLPEIGQDQSILRILARRFKMQWSRACEVISSLIADAEVAELLAVQPNTPILSQACTAFDDQQKPVFYDQVYRQSPITYNLDKVAPNRSAGQTAG